MHSGAARRARLQHLLSYLLISLVPVILCSTLVLHLMYQGQATALENTTFNGLELMKNKVNFLLQNVDICVSHFNGGADMARDSAEEMAQQLAAYKGTYPGFSEIIYYEKGSDRVISTEGPMEYLAFQRAFEGDINMDMSKVFQQMNQALSPVMLNSRSAGDYLADGDQLILIRPVPLLSANPAGVLVFFVPHATIQAFLEDCVDQPQALYLLTDQNLGHLFRGAHSRDLEDRLFKLRGAGVFREQVDGEDYVFFRALSEDNAIYHLMAISERDLFAEIRAQAWQTGLVFLGMLVLVAVAAMLLHKIIYRPIQHMLEVPLPRDASGQRVGDIYAHVRSRVQDVTIEKDRLAELLEDQRQSMRQQALHNLLFGYVGPQQALQLAELGLELRAPYYAVAYGKLEEEGQVYGLTDGEAYALPGAMAYLAMLEDNRRIAMLINHQEPDALQKGLAQALVEALAKRGIVLGRVGVGASCGRLEDINLSAIQGQAIFYLKEAPGTGQIRLFEDSQRSPDLSNAFIPAADKALLWQCMWNGQKDIARSTLEKIRQDALSLALSPSAARSWCLYLYEAVFNCFRDLKLTELMERIPRLAVFASPDLFCAQLLPMIEEACDRVHLEKRQQRDEQSCQLIDFVQEHYHEAQMSLEYLSGVFHLSESYLTRFFRKTTGESFLRYISGLRMERVKHLLVATDMPIREIVNQCGYVDVANFTRKFRQQEGITPGAYRQRERGGDLLEGAFVQESGQPNHKNEEV